MIIGFNFYSGDTSYYVEFNVGLDEDNIPTGEINVSLTQNLSVDSTVVAKSIGEVVWEE